MTTFYYIAVSNSGNQRLAGEIAGNTELAARAELNKLGLSVLSISTTPFAETTSTGAKKFEFEGVDRYEKAVSGSIDAKDTFVAFERLKGEFGFAVSYLCGADASPAEKAAARSAGVAEFQKEEIRTIAEKINNEKSMFKMSLKEMVQQAEQKLRSKTVNTSIDGSANPPEKSEGTRSVENTASTGITTTTLIGTIDVNDHENISLQKLDLVSADSVAAANRENATQSKYSIFSDLLKNPFATNTTTISTPTNVTEAPPTTYAARFPLFRHFNFNLHTNWREVLDPHAIVGELFTILTITFITAFCILKLAASYHLGALTTFAIAATNHSTLIAFLGLAFLFVRLTIALHTRFTVDVLPRTAALYGLTAFTIIIAGFNVVY